MMVSFFFAFIVIYALVSLVWPTARKQERQVDYESTRRHQELLEAVDRAKTRSQPQPRPTFGSAERARVLGLGRIRDGQHRHPVLDSPYVSVANAGPLSPCPIDVSE
jgi:hypothetical protein